MPTRSAKADWRGTAQEGGGKVAFGQFNEVYNFKGRTGDGTGTNAEELLAASQASCYTMALAARLSSHNVTVDDIQTTAKVTLSTSGLGFKISRIQIETKAHIPGLTQEEFKKHARIAKDNCPIANALAAVHIDLNAKLVEDKTASERSVDSTE